MSITFEVFSGNNQDFRPLSGSCIWDLQRLSREGFKEAVAIIAGEENAELGDKRIVSCKAVLEAIDQLLLPAKKLPGGFQVRMKETLGPGVAISEWGVMGILIEGVPFTIRCTEDYWWMSATRLPPGKRHVVPPGRRGEHRREPAEFHTDNVGLVKVEALTGKKSDLARMLAWLRKFLVRAGDKNAMIIIG